MEEYIDWRHLAEEDISSKKIDNNTEKKDIFGFESTDKEPKKIDWKKITSNKPLLLGIGAVLGISFVFTNDNTALKGLGFILCIGVAIYGTLLYQKRDKSKPLLKIKSRRKRKNSDLPRGLEYNDPSLN